MQLNLDTQLNNLTEKIYTLYNIDSNWTIMFTVNPNNPNVVTVDRINHDDPTQNSSDIPSLDDARREWKHYVSYGYTRQ